MLNITAHGNLGKDPEIKYLESGLQVAKFSLAARTGKDETTWMDCSVWGKRSETAANYLRKGSAITISGRGKINTFTAQDGKEVRKLEVDVTDFTLPPRDSNQNNSESPF